MNDINREYIMPILAVQISVRVIYPFGITRNLEIKTLSFYHDLLKNVLIYRAY